MFVHLIFDCFHHTGMPMADVGDTDARDHVKVALALRTIQAGSFGAFDRYSKRKGRSLRYAMTEDISIKIHPAKIRRIKRHPKKKASTDSDGGQHLS